jgi:hypothetical protein
MKNEYNYVYTVVSSYALVHNEDFPFVYVHCWRKDLLWGWRPPYMCICVDSWNYAVNRRQATGLTFTTLAC